MAKSWWDTWDPEKVRSPWWVTSVDLPAQFRDSKERTSTGRGSGGQGIVELFLFYVKALAMLWDPPKSPPGAKSIPDPKLETHSLPAHWGTMATALAVCS